MAGGAAVAVALAALLLLGRGKGAYKMTSPGPKQPIRSTYDGTAAQWAKRRYELAYDYFSQHWAGATDPKEAALSVLAHWSLETGAGSAEHNFNVGNIHATGMHKWFGGGDVDEKGNPYNAAFAAYDSLDDGINAYFELLETNYYKDCLESLTGDPESAEWFKCLGRKGYYAKTRKDPKTGAIVDNIEPAAAGWAARRANLAQYATS